MEETYVSMFEIRKLFNKYDVKIDLEKECNVLIGANGIGKSTALKILYYIAIGDFTKAPFVPFDKIIVHRKKKDYLDYVEVEYDDFFPDIEYLVLEYMGLISDIDIESGQRWNELREMLGNAGAYDERSELFVQAMMELKEKKLYGVFIYDWFYGLVQPNNVMHILKKYKIDYELLASNCFLRIQNDVVAVLAYEGSKLGRVYIEEAIDNGFLDLNDLEKEFFYFDLVQNYVISNNQVNRSSLYDAETEWAFSERKAEKNKGFIPFPLREKAINMHPEIVMSVHGKEYDEDIFYRGYSFEEYFNDEDSLNLKPIRNKLYNEKILLLNELINRAFYSRELILDINNRIKKYSDKYYELISDLDDEMLDGEELDKALLEINNRFSLEIKQDYETYIHPILVNNSFFDYDILSIRNIYSHTSNEYLDSIMYDIDEMMDDFPREKFKKLKYRELLLDYMDEVLPILKDSNNKSIKIIKFEKLIKKYLADKYIEIRPSGMFIKDGVILSNESPVFILYDENDIDLSVISSGERKILMMFAISIFFDDWIIILDEPELSLSLVWQESLLKDMVAEGNQFKILAATHSPYIVQDENIRPFITYLPQV